MFLWLAIWRRESYDNFYLANIYYGKDDDRWGKNYLCSGLGSEKNDVDQKRKECIQIQKKTTHGSTARSGSNYHSLSHELCQSPFEPPLYPQS